MAIHLESQPLQAHQKPVARHDEVWGGTTIVPPMPNNEHQTLAFRMGMPLGEVIVVPNLGTVQLGANISDRAQDWTKNYRCPDVIVYLNTNPAINHGTHWEGGPDFLVEILSPGDRALQKLPFYASINTREVLIIDRDPWQLSLYQLQQQQLQLVGVSDVATSQLLISSVLPLSFQLIQGTARPTIMITHTQSQQQWQA